MRPSYEDEISARIRATPPLVFSQFTSFLTIVQSQLGDESIPYEYLDEKTPIHERQERVHRFQSDPWSKLFLIVPSQVPDDSLVPHTGRHLI